MERSIYGISHNRDMHRPSWITLLQNKLSIIKLELFYRLTNETSMYK